MEVMEPLIVVTQINVPLNVVNRISSNVPSQNQEVTVNIPMLSNIPVALMIIIAHLDITALGLPAKKTPPVPKTLLSSFAASASAAFQLLSVPF